MGVGDTNQDTLEQTISCWKFPMVVARDLVLDILYSHMLLLTQKPRAVGMLCASSGDAKMQPITFVQVLVLF